ncbi:MAG: DoxX family protein [Balneolaceae bacterium]|nr:DoxX family protein [Balneolaceae bacterium]
MTIIQLLTDFLKNSAEDIGKLLLRLLFSGALALNHGYQTFIGSLSFSASFPDPLGIGPGWSMLLVGFAEFICALLVAAGFYTRVVVIPVILNFSVAFFLFHAGDSFGEKELAYLYLCAMIAILLLGPGSFSIDGLKSKLVERREYPPGISRYPHSGREKCHNQTPRVYPCRDRLDLGRPKHPVVFFRYGSA